MQALYKTWDAIPIVACAEGAAEPLLCTVPMELVPLSGGGADEAEASPVSDPAEPVVPAVDAPPASPASCCSKVGSFLLSWHLPIGLVVLVVFGFLVPVPGKFLGDSTPLSTINVVVIFFVSGMKLKMQDVKSAFRDWGALTVGMVMILGVTPLFGFIASTVDMGSVAVSNGLALFCAMPTTISSGVLLAVEAGGNSALALSFSVASNLLGTVTAPPYLSVLLKIPPGLESAGGIDTLEILWQLVTTVCVPLLVGVFLRYFAAVRAFAQRYKTPLSLLSSLLLVMIPWMKVSQSASKILRLQGSTFGALVGMAMALHILMILAMMLVALPLPFSNSSRKTMIILGSEKTVGIAVAFLAFLPPALEPGVMVISCLVAHFIQLLMDAFLAILLRKWMPSTPELSPSPVHGSEPATPAEELKSASEQV
jgi:solute carrier family 10 (sodium/bile acid cotransporter), member 7